MMYTSSYVQVRFNDFFLKFFKIPFFYQFYCSAVSYAGVSFRGVAGKQAKKAPMFIKKTLGHTYRVRVLIYGRTRAESREIKRVIF